MTEIIKIGRQECKLIREVLDSSDLQGLLADLGLKFSIGNMTFDGATVTTKLTIAVADYNADETEFKKGCWKFDLRPRDFGRKFESNGDTFTICGLKPRSHKYPVIGKRADGKKFKFPARLVAKQLADAS